MDDIVGTLLKKATEQKKSGDINNAILTLKLAYGEIAKTTIEYPVETFLRLPMYLQEAKQNDEAWKEFNKILAYGFPNQIKDKEVFPAQEGIIYDKMRLFLQREKKHQTAIIFGIFSYLKWTIAIYRQKRFAELKHYQDKKEIKEMLAPLLKKAQKENCIQDLTALVFNEANNPDKIDIATLNKNITAIMDTGSPTA